MERRAKVELFEEIRREYEFGAGTVSVLVSNAGSPASRGLASAGFRRASRLNRAFITIRPRLLPVSSSSCDIGEALRGRSILRPR